MTEAITTDDAGTRLHAVREDARLKAMDAARGFALLGIFVVNVWFFGDSLGTVMDLHPAKEPVERAIRTIVHVGFEFKFYALFSMLFGAGFVLQRGRVKSAGGAWVPLYLRRVGFLMGLGLVHALGVWYGDILFLYALAGLVLLGLGWLRPRTLVVVAVIVMALSTLLGIAVTAAQFPGPRPTEAAGAAAPAGEEGAPTPGPAGGVGDSEAYRSEFWRTPFGDVIKGFKTGTLTQGPTDPRWLENERRAYRDGPYLQVFLFRAMTWLSMLTYCLFGFGWNIVGLMFIGAAVAKVEGLSSRHARWHRRGLLVALCVGLPLAAAGRLFQEADVTRLSVCVNFAAQMTASPLMALGFLCFWALMVNNGWAGVLTNALAATGRMALTNYLTQSLVATTVFYYYGLGMFGRMSAPAMIGLVLGVYAAQVCFSAAWMRWFRYGPMEWLWRSATYLALPPMRRRG